MPVTLIEQKPTFTKKVEGKDKLVISEMFADTIQGEGIFAGTTATFIRLQGCTLQCVWCDTIDVWPHGNEYSFDEIFEMFESIDLITKFKAGQHLILTGGSPLKQQRNLVEFLNAFKDKYQFTPYIEVENETVLLPDSDLEMFVACWNNSPKLQNSGMKTRARYKPEVVKYMASRRNSWFKFVVDSEMSWDEINEFYLKPGLISRSHIIIMPEGQNQEQLAKTRELAADIAIREGVRFSDRLHITIWDKKTGV
jgi:7-carboxy-7-deazaguanine synthase